jgi:hypothetical protein
MLGGMLLHPPGGAPIRQDCLERRALAAEYAAAPGDLFPTDQMLMVWLEFK